MKNGETIDEVIKSLKAISFMLTPDENLADDEAGEEKKEAKPDESANDDNTILFRQTGAAPRKRKPEKPIPSMGIW